MKTLGRIAVVLAAAFVATFAVATSAAAQDAEAEYDEDYEAQQAAKERARADRDEPLAFMPTLAMSFGSYNQSISGDTAQLIPDGDGGTQNVPFERAQGDSLITEYFQFTGRLHTPLQLEDFPTKPRLFISAGVQIPLASGLIAERIDTIVERSPAGGTPTVGYENSCPDTLPDGEGGTVPSNECSLKVRNRVTLDAMWFTGIGVDLTIPAPALDTKFHIMPAVEYYGLSIQTFGEFGRITTGTSVPDVEESTSSVGDPEIYHGVSGSLAMAVDVFEDGPWLWSMFLQGRVVYLLNSPQLSASGPTSGGDILYESAIDDYIFQGSMGFQIQYTGMK